MVKRFIPHHNRRSIQSHPNPTHFCTTVQHPPEIAFLITTKRCDFFKQRIWLSSSKYFNFDQPLASLVISAVVGIVGMMVTGTSRFLKSMSTENCHSILNSPAVKKWIQYLQVLARRPLQGREGGRGLPPPALLLPCPDSLAIRTSGGGVCVKLWFYLNGMFWTSHSFLLY